VSIAKSSRQVSVESPDSPSEVLALLFGEHSGDFAFKLCIGPSACALEWSAGSLLTAHRFGEMSGCTHDRGPAVRGRE